MSHELSSVQEAEAKVLRSLAPGLNHISDNPDLETAYLDYEATRLDAMHGEGADVVKLNQLPESQKRQIGTVVMNLIGGGLLSPDVAQKRLQRVRVRVVDEDLMADGKDVGGEFKQGLATVKMYEDPSLQNHALTHEVTHGLVVPGWAMGDLGFVISVSGGLASARTADHEEVDPDDISILNDMQEAIIDTVTLSASDVNVVDYLLGKYQVGYGPEAIKLGKLAASQPELAVEAMRAVFKTGLRSNEQVRRLADAYSAVS